MAKQTIVRLTDDLDGSTEAEHSLSFAIEGRNYEIDLSQKNYDSFMKATQKYVDAARTVRGASGRPAAKRATGGSGRTPDELAAVREWAKANGYEVAERGRIAQAVLDAYDAS